MPIPSPRSGEPQKVFISRCISTLNKLDPNRPSKQVVAICYSRWRQKELKKLLSKSNEKNIWNNRK